MILSPVGDMWTRLYLIEAIVPTECPVGALQQPLTLSEQAQHRASTLSDHVCMRIRHQGFKFFMNDALGYGMDFALLRIRIHVHSCSRPAFRLATSGNKVA